MYRFSKSKKAQAGSVADRDVSHILYLDGGKKKRKSNGALLRGTSELELKLEELGRPAIHFHPSPGVM